mgnify:CR=1 FL=1
MAVTEIALLDEADAVSSKLERVKADLDEARAQLGCVRQDWQHVCGELRLAEMRLAALVAAVSEALGVYSLPSFVNPREKVQRILTTGLEAAARGKGDGNA